MSKDSGAGWAYVWDQSAGCYHIFQALASPDVAAGGQVCYISSALPSPQAEAIMENFTAEYSTTTIGSAILWELL